MILQRPVLSISGPEVTQGPTKMKALRCISLGAGIQTADYTILVGTGGCGLKYGAAYARRTTSSRGQAQEVIVSQATPFSAYSASLWEKGLATAIYQACVPEMLGLMMSQN